MQQESVRVVAGDKRLAIRADQIVRGAVVLLVVLGLGLRAQGYLFHVSPFWLDECSWAELVMTRPLSELVIRPIAFMAATRAIVHYFSASETWFRLLPWCGGVAVTIMTPFIARRLFESRAAQLLLVASVALSPGAIDLSKEFKPYSVALAIHCGLLLLGLRYVATGRARDLLFALSLAIPGVLFAQDVVFAYPGLFLALAIGAWKSSKRRHLIIIGVSAGAALLLTLCLYFFMWKAASTSKETSFWGKKYDVFYERDADNTERSQIEWVAGKYAGLATLPGMRREFWQAKWLSDAALERLRILDGFIWLGLSITGIACILRKGRLFSGLLLITPLVTMVACNVFRVWPFGPFRANLFTLCYTGPIAAFGVEFARDRFATAARRAQAGIFLVVAPALLLVVAPFLALDSASWDGRKRSFSLSSAFPSAINRLLAIRGASPQTNREPLILDLYSCASWDYYSKFNPRFSRDVAPEVERRFSIQCVAGHNAKDVAASARRRLKQLPRVSIIVARPATLSTLARSWPDDVETPRREVFGGGDTMLLQAQIKPL